VPTLLYYTWYDLTPFSFPFFLLNTPCTAGFAPTVKASSVLGCPLDAVEVVGDGGMMATLSSLIHPIQDALAAPAAPSATGWFLPGV